MKVVLRQDVPKLGEAGDVKDVAGGYARNFLIPQGMAVYASEGELKMAAHNKAVKERKIARQEEQLRSLAEKIQGTSLVFTARAGEGGRLFGSVTAADIATQLSEKIGEEIDRRKVELAEPLRSLGNSTVAVHLVGRLRPEVTVTINPETAPAEEAAAEESTEAAEETVEA
ncbi:MAG TPA: 50S ribosomal protein L9 [Thermomicrobiales bacterium]|nr:50S ribosomal protein L9 [Thermomicrobiales bacterium]